MRNFCIAVFCLYNIAVVANPLLIGNWQGFIVQNYTSKVDAIYLDCSLTISSATADKIAGSIEIAIKHSNGKTYRSKANISGIIDPKTYAVSFIAEEFVYQDILPENAKWCLGFLNGGIFRSKTNKQFLIKGYYKTKCQEQTSFFAVYKQ